MAGYALTYLDESRRNTPIWKYQSDPKKPLNWDQLLRVATEPIMRIVSDGVIAHHTDWADVPHQEHYQGVKLSRDPQAFVRQSFVDAVLVDTRFGWRSACVLQLDQSALNEKVDSWQIGYRSNDNTVRKCLISVPAGESIKMAIGSGDITFYGLDKNNQELPLKNIAIVDRRDPQFHHLRML